MSTTMTAEPLTTRTALAAVGGKRGIVDGGLPPLVFVIVNSVVTVSAARTDALRWALAAALAAGVAIIVLRRARRETLKEAMRGLAGLGIAGAFAAGSGEARDFFVPGMIVDAVYAVVFAGSVLVARPIVGSVYALLARRRIPWREDLVLRRIFVTATLGWALVFAARAGAQIVFYQGDRPGLLAISKLVMGWPLTVLAVVLTLAYVRRTTARPFDAAPGPRLRRGEARRAPGSARAR